MPHIEIQGIPLTFYPIYFLFLDSCSAVHRKIAGICGRNAFAVSKVNANEQLTIVSTIHAILVTIFHFSLEALSGKDGILRTQNLVAAADTGVESKRLN